MKPVTIITRKRVKPFWLFLFFVGFLWLVPQEAPLLDWDEINFAECAREMLLTGHYTTVTINYLPFYQKPPFFFWLQALSMSLFGLNAYAARLPNVLCGLLTLWLLRRWGKRFHSEAFGETWAVFYAVSFLPQLYFQSGIIDPVFNLLIVGAILQFLERHYGYAALCIGLAVLTKGFVAWLFFGLTLTGLLWNEPKRIGSLLLTFLLSVLVAGLWFGLDFWQEGSAFTRAFLDYQWALLTHPGAGHRGFWGYHLVVLFFGVFPASIWALPHLFGKPKTDPDRLWLMLFWSVLLVFSVVQTKIIHYSSLCYFPLTYWAAQSWQQDARRPAMLRLALGVGFLFALVLLLLPLLGQHFAFVLAWLDVKQLFLLALTEVKVSWSLWQGAGLGLGLAAVVWQVYRKGADRRTVAAYFLILNLALWLYVPRVAAYTQGAALEFYQEHAAEDAYFLPVGFKTYGHLFYGAVPPEDRPKYPEKNRWEQFLLSGKADRPVYFIVRADRLPYWNAQPKSAAIERLYQKNGFTFFRLLPEKQKK